MFFHISIHRIEARKISDHPMDPFDNANELYQTWHFSALEDMQNTSPSSWARQGCSSRGAPNDGTTFRDGDDLIVTDPQITLGIAEDATALGSVRQFRLDFHHWESDPGSATEKVRAAFTDITLAYMAHAWKVAGEDAAKARAALVSWVSENWKDSAKAIAAAVAPTGAWTQVGFNLLPAIELLVGLLQEQGDDYWALHRFILQHRGNGSALEWQITPADGGSGGWKVGAGCQDFTQRVSDAEAKNVLDVTYRFRLVE